METKDKVTEMIDRLFPFKDYEYTTDSNFTAIADELVLSHKDEELHVLNDFLISYVILAMCTKDPEAIRESKSSQSMRRGVYKYFIGDIFDEVVSESRSLVDVVYDRFIVLFPQS